jgi:hypothetical protein
MVAAKGAYYTDADGRQIFDGLSGLWTCGAGHGREEITRAVSAQIAEMDYSPGFQFGHALSFQLANKIVDLTPDGLDHVFFTDSGSETIDTALKIARAYWRSRGHTGKSKFIGRMKGYHGANYGGVGVGGIGFNRKLFGQTVDADHIAHTLLEENRFSKGMPESGFRALLMVFIRLSIVLLSQLALAACGLGAAGVRPTISLYCDNFLVYKMCARDMDRDGIVEFVYFEESEVVFMWREGARDDIPADMEIHQCAEAMPSELVVTTNRVFFVDDETSYLERQDIRGGMMIEYITALPRVAACNLGSDQSRGESHG